MTAGKGALVLIKVGDGAIPETFHTIGGLRTSHMLLDNQSLDTSNIESGAWRQLLGNAGIRLLRISGSGVFTDSTSEEAVRQYALAGSVKNYRFVFANGDYITGPFQVIAYERSGHHDSEEAYSLMLES